MTTLKRDITTTFSGNIISTILLFGTAVVFARVLGPANRGLLALALLVPDILEKICSFGHLMVNSTFAGLYKDKRPSLFQQTLVVVLLGSSIGIAAMCAFYFWLPLDKGRFTELSTDIILLSCLVIPTAMLARLLIALMRGAGQITKAAIVYVVQTGILFVLAFTIMVLFNGGIKAAVLSTAISASIGAVIAIWMLRDYVTLKLSAFSPKLFKKAMAFGSQISLSTIARLLNFRVDQLILAFMVPLEQVGYYVIAVGFAERLRLIPTSISTAFLPWLANERSDRQAYVPMVFRCTVIISFVSILLVAILGVPAIILFFGKQYSGAIASFLYLLPGIAVLGGNSILASDLAAKEKPHYSVMAGYATLIVNISLNLLLIPHIGIAGAAIASTISYTLAGILWFGFFIHESKEPLKNMIPTKQDIVFIQQHLFAVLRKKDTSQNQIIDRDRQEN